MDRNVAAVVVILTAGKSLSARRAWIEIVCRAIATDPIFVALRKESVDRNKIMYQGAAQVRDVALRKESVDRNQSARMV